MRSSLRVWVLGAGHSPLGLNLLGKQRMGQIRSWRKSLIRAENLPCLGGSHVSILLPSHPLHKVHQSLAKSCPRRTNSGRRVAIHALLQRFAACQGPNLGGSYSFHLTTSLRIVQFEIHISRCICSQENTKQQLWPGQCTMSHPPLGLCFTLCRDIAELERNWSCSTAPGAAPGQTLPSASGTIWPLL